MIDNQSDNYSLLLFRVLSQLTYCRRLLNINLSEIQYYNFKIGEIGGIDNVILSRTGYTGELGFELYVKNEDVKELWEALFLLQYI